MRDGGAAINGVSRAALNKLVGAYFEEGMRKPSRNSTTQAALWAGDSPKLARHFLKARWRSPDDMEDRMVLSSVFNNMCAEEIEQIINILREFQQFTAVPVVWGRGILSHDLVSRPRDLCERMEKMPRTRESGQAIPYDLAQCTASSRSPDPEASAKSGIRRREFEEGRHELDEQGIRREAAALVAAIRAG